MERVKVVRVVPDADLRKVHVYRKRVNNLRVGEAVLYVNRAGDKARLIDSSRSVHNYYAPNGTVFDLEMMQNMVKSLRLVLILSASKAQRAFRKSKSSTVALRRAA
jgi:hypothetical protein